MEVSGHNIINGMPTVLFVPFHFGTIYDFPRMCYQKGSILPPFHKKKIL